MRADIHPEYKVVKASCSCGNVIEVGSTVGRNLNLEVCSECHPFYTGKQKLVDTAGRVEDFYRKYGGQQKDKSNQEAAE